jgi:hypothetical protein
MTKKRLDVNRSREVNSEDLKPALKRFGGSLKDNGLRKSTIDMYVFRAGKFLEFSHSDTPSEDDFLKFRELLMEQVLSKSTINNYSFSIKKYYEMLGKTIDFPFLKPMNTIPYYFDENDIFKIFSCCNNIKHLINA